MIMFVIGVDIVKDVEVSKMNPATERSTDTKFECEHQNII